MPLSSELVINNMNLEMMLIDLLNLVDLSITRINDNRSSSGVAYLIETKDAGTEDVVSRLYTLSISHGIETVHNSTIDYFNRRAWEKELEEDEEEEK